MCARLRMFSQLLNHPLSLSPHLAVPSPRISLFSLWRFFFFKSLARMCVHANTRLKGPYAPMCVRVYVCVPVWRR